MIDLMTTSGVAAYYTERGYPLKSWQVRRTYEVGLMPEPAYRAGMYRLICREDLPALGQALWRLGYLPDEVATAAVAEPVNVCA